MSPADRDQQPSHPTLVAALLMIGIAVALVLVANEQRHDRENCASDNHRCTEHLRLGKPLYNAANTSKKQSVKRRRASHVLAPAEQASTLRLSAYP